jgi:hypothetical protein
LDTAAAGEGAYADPCDEPGDGTADGRGKQVR